MDSDSPLRRVPRTFGKVQGHNPGRWLTRDEAFGHLVTGCQDGSLVGLRDEIVIRLALAGMRGGEIRTLRIGSLALHLLEPEIAWIGKGRSPRSLHPGRNLADALNRYLDSYRATKGELQRDWPLIAPTLGGSHGNGRLRFGDQSSYATIFRIVQNRAAAAGLGHVAPHDLRRTTAKLLHDERDIAGGHVFDLRDVQKVMGHASPTTTVLYLDILDNEANVRAATVLD